MYKKYHVIGLQRTGTNWLNELIQYNFYVEPTQADFWKHLTTLGVKSRRNYWRQWNVMEKDLFLKDDTFYIATSKDWELWCESLRKNAEDFSKSHRGVIYKNPNGTRDVYNAWHDWKNKQLSCDNFVYHNYLDWFKNWQTYLEDIHKATGWKKKHSFYKDVPYDIPRSKNFDRMKYIMELDNDQTK